MTERFTPVVDSRPDDVVWAPLMEWPPPVETVLRGSTVELTPVDVDLDGPVLFEALNDERVWRHLPAHPRDAAEFTDALAASMRSTDRFPWVVRLVRPLGSLPAGAVVGTSSYLDISVAAARLEIGWTAYSQAVWAGPVNPEAKLLLLSYAFDALGAGRVQLKTDVRNTRSQQAIARLGARYEGTLRRYQPRADGTMRDTVLFSIIAEEWPSVRAGLEERLAAFG